MHYEEIRREIVCEIRQSRRENPERRSYYYDDMKQTLVTLKNLEPLFVDELQYVYNEEAEYITHWLYYSTICKAVIKIEQYYNAGLNDKSYYAKQITYRNAYNTLKKYNTKEIHYEFPPLPAETYRQYIFEQLKCLGLSQDGVNSVYDTLKYSLDGGKEVGNKKPEKTKYYWSTLQGILEKRKLFNERYNIVITRK